ncbi:hypothetical protein [Nonomuraea roseoviolacea]|uniref:Uncharacterized protein n=1 Tax=Nonomuraea roseoviolacea subsp. carminata TaxID=160689 RepID=A0ABT1JUB2_9ACTN|nr:hypothetical protein [Nonomuraea roseoviolacea]MCP2345343.1 hypothetical protein [Nonomuraea roseoviolacea subsp. carminata]
MDAMQVLAHQTAMGYRDSLHEALPDAPVRASRSRAQVRRRLAGALRSTADRLDPVAAC